MTQAQQEINHNSKRQPLTNNMSNSYSLNNYAIFDLETTGLDPTTDSILEIYVKSNNKRASIYHSYLKYDGYINPKVSSINRITHAMVCNAPNQEDVLDYVYKTFSNYIFVGHNSHDFDMKFLVRYNKKFVDINFLDTRILAKMVLPGCEKYSMSYLCGLFGIEIINQHTAKGDVDALSLLFDKLLRLLDNPYDVNKCIKSGSLSK